MDGPPVPRVERTVSFLFRSLDGDMIENDGNSVGFDKGVTLEARLAKCKARLQQYVEDDSLRKRRNAALLADVQKLKEELNGFCLEDYFSVQERARPERVNVTRMTPMGELSVPKPSATTGTDTEDLDYQSSSREHVDATAQTRESDFRHDSEDRLVEEVRVPIARKESSSTSEASYLVQSRRSSAGIPGLRRQSSTSEHLVVEEGEEGSQADYEIGAVDHGDVQSKQTIAEMPSKMKVEQKIVGTHETSLYRVDIVNHHRSADDTAQDVRVEEVAGAFPDERILEAASSQEDEKRLVVDDQKRPPSVISREASEPSSNPNQRDSSTVDDDSFFDEGGTAVNAAYLKLLGGTSEPRKALEGGMEDVDEDMETRIATKLVENASDENASSQQPASQARANMGNILKKVAGESDEDVSLEGGHASDKDDDFF